MLKVPGASATVLEARVPYATEATQELLGQKVASFCSQETAVLLAKRAFERAAELTSPGTPILGLSCTAALRTVRHIPLTSQVFIDCVLQVFLAASEQMVVVTANCAMLPTTEDEPSGGTAFIVLLPLCDS